MKDGTPSLLNVNFQRRQSRSSASDIDGSDMSAEFVRIVISKEPQYPTMSASAPDSLESVAESSDTPIPASSPSLPAPPCSNLGKL